MPTSYREDCENYKNMRRDSTNFGYEDVPYKKRAKKKKNKRSNHKHEYAKCLIKSLDFPKYWSRGEYCIHCGRIKNITLSWGYYDKLSQEELDKLPRFEIQSFLDKNVSLQDKN